MSEFNIEEIAREAVEGIKKQVSDAITQVTEAKETVKAQAGETFEKVKADVADAAFTVKTEAGTKIEQAKADVADAAAKIQAQAGVAFDKAKAKATETMDDFSNEVEKSVRKVKPGDIMEGEVIAVNENGAILDLNYYATGRVPADEMSEDPSFSILRDVKIGDRFKAIVKTVDDGKGCILLSRKMADSECSWDKLSELMENGAVVTGTISDVVKSGAIMYVEGIRGFIPASKLDVKYVEDTAPYLGRTMSVKISEVDEDNRKLILSAKEILTEKYLEEQNEKINKMVVGSVVTGKVETLKDYGAFVDLGDGISGLLHVSQISEKKIAHPKAELKVGQEVKVMITAIKDGKISLSMKALIEKKEEEEEKELEEEAVEYKSEYVPNNPFADLLKDFIKK